MRQKKIGRPKLSPEKTRHNFCVRLTDKERLLLEKCYGNVQNAVNEILLKAKGLTKRSKS